MTAPEEIQQEIEQTRECLARPWRNCGQGRREGQGPGQGRRAEGEGTGPGGRALGVSQSQTVRRDWPLALVAAGILAIGAGLVRRRRKT